MSVAGLSDNAMSWQYYKLSCRGNELFVRAASPAHAKDIVKTIVSMNKEYGYPFNIYRWDIIDEGPYPVPRLSDIGGISSEPIPEKGTFLQ